MNGAKIYQQQICGSRNYQIKSYFLPTVMGSIQATSISNFNSRLWVYYEVKRDVIKFWIC